MGFQAWYDNLIKPAWTPSPDVISLIWTILYPVILASFGLVIVQTIRRRLSWFVALPFILNLIANILFMPIFGWMRNLPLAMVDILIVQATVVWKIQQFGGNCIWHNLQISFVNREDSDRAYPPVNNAYAIGIGYAGRRGDLYRGGSHFSELSCTFGRFAVPRFRSTDKEWE